MDLNVLITTLPKLIDAQVNKEVRIPFPAAPRPLERYDYEYKRNGVVNLVGCFEPLAG